MRFDVVLMMISDTVSVTILSIKDFNEEYGYFL